MFDVYGPVQGRLKHKRVREDKSFETVGRLRKDVERRKDKSVDGTVRVRSF
jgi:hypothetical protein